MRGLWIALVVGCGGGSNNGAAVCGDGDTVAGIEECDDGNLFDGDGCSAQCRDEGCGDGLVQSDEQCDDANDVDDDACTNSCERPGGNAARLDASWTFTTLGDLTSVPCVPPVTTVVLESQGTAGGPPFRDEFACGPGSGTAFLPPDRYRVHLDVIDPDDPQKTIAEGLPADVDLRVGDGMYDAEIVVDGGFFDVAWEIVDGNGTPLDCAQVPGVDRIEVTSNGSGGPIVDVFDCEPRHGLTSALLAGGYQISVRAVTAANTALNNDADVTGTILNANRVTPVPAVITIAE